MKIALNLVVLLGYVILKFLYFSKSIMKVPFFWLKEYLPLTLTVEEVADVLTILGLEVEGVERAQCTFTDVVVGEVLTAEKHPHADRLQVATVTDGHETFQVVCGAPNCRAGLKTAFAKIGAKLTDPAGKTFAIKKSKLRDVESYGMLCAAEELGLSIEGSSGILELPSDAPLGAPLADVLSEPILEVSLTPNLGHCLCMTGIARELAAHQKLPLHIPQGTPKESSHPVEKEIQVVLEAADACPRYACRYISGIEVRPSPDWLKKRLESAGLKSINNIVDIGNYVMLEMGQPLHMFDAAKIRGKKIVIRKAEKEGVLTTLDSAECKYAAGTLLICDAEGPLAIAGVMGGLESAITDATKEIAIESAHFDPAAVRKASKQTGLRSDSSYRFERSTDIGGVVNALNRAAGLVIDLAGGNAAQGVIDVCPAGIHPRTVTCRVQRVNSMLGVNLSQNEIRELLERLGMKVQPEGQDLLRVAVPTFRNDVRAEIDLIEEVVRLYGYNNVPRPLVRHISATFPDAPIFTFENTVRNILLQEGLQECVTCDLIGPAQAAIADKQGIQQDAIIRVLHPSSADQSILRHSLLPNLLQVVKHNQDQKQDVVDLAAFEVGKIHFQHGGKFKEQLMAGIVLCGKSAPYHFQPLPQEWDFLDLKGIVENLAPRLHLDFTFAPTHLTAFHPFRQAHVAAGEQIIGTLGEIHPEALRSLGIKQRVYFAELNLHDLFPLSKKPWQVKPLPSFPGTERDWTLTLHDHTPVASLFSAIRQEASPLLSDFFLLAVYKSEQLGKDKKNVTVRFIYRDPAQTIEMETAEKEHTLLMQRVAQKIRDHVV